jgi:uncharacterized protein YdiU (UPF0061 family)
MPSSLESTALDELVFDNRFTRELPADPDETNRSRQVFGACFSRVRPAKVRAPELVAFASELAGELGLSPETCRSQDFVQVFSGNRLLEGMDPHATCYGGHQFGHWAGQLGDGRAINLGEIAGRDDKRWTLQLKGAGPTPYSRSADGLAVLRSSVREFLCSEAMFHLGVPTTRALSLVLTGEQVMRDMFYDGRPALEPGAIVCRVAPSFTRFGSFEIFASRGEIAVLRQLADFTIRNDFSHLGEPSKETYVAWFTEVCQKTAELIVHWMRVGFVHGVMNTDNMSITGLTIDYGPYGWLDDFDPDWTPNTTDAAGRRYRFGNQSQIALWNLVQLANAIHPLVEDVPALQSALETYPKTFNERWPAMMASKLGFESYQGEPDNELFTELQTLLRLVETDMTIFYRRLALVDDDARDDAMPEPLMAAFYTPDALTEETRRRWGRWLRAYRTRLHEDDAPSAVRRKRMNAVNPKYVLRNYMAQLATDQAETGDFSRVEELLDVLRHPYDEQPGNEEHAQKRPDWARDRPGCSMLSCSS